MCSRKKKRDKILHLFQGLVDVSRENILLAFGQDTMKEME